MYDFDIGGALMGLMVMAGLLALGLLAVLVMWLANVRPDWWMLWVLVGMGAMAILSTVTRCLTK